MSGINTLLQTLIGTRLPTVMGPSFASTLPVLSIMNDYSDENFSNGHEQKGSLTHIILYKNEVTSQTTHCKNHGPPTIDQQPNRCRFVPVEARGIDRGQGLQPRVLSVGDELNTFSSEVVPVVFADGSPSGGPRLSFATGVWIDKSLSFTDSYKQVVDNVYKAASNQVDFQTKVIGAFDGFKVLGLPYKQGEDKRRFSMYFFLPDAKDGLPALVEKMGSESGFLDRHLPRQKVEVGDLRIPRFKISFGFETSN
ncbi:hypothetical protein LWI29_013890 [Acer saccharum]|uniref:Serpin domain-containing protein n=1 Tax=Acer saccharum TaxID=4024 RepID=A0AA39VFI4_ACESA|nr:hypothetical protein LWI29_013890 [Acer saccharum]